ncbi:MAG: response regulator PleD [bacterium ADurb.Bin429]|nr:MAG: response regulator PleD [bacterium ADurb.Bin429]
MHVPEPITGTVVLIDNTERLPLAQAVLEGEGFTVRVAKTLAEGMALIEAEHPDAVVSEVMLETPDAGFVLAYRMKANPALKSIPLILLSSVYQQTGILFDLNTPEARQWIKADAYLERPVAPERLVTKVRSLLQTH